MLLCSWQVVEAADEGGGSYRGWVGGVEALEALVAAGPGRLEGRLLEAAWTFDNEALRRACLGVASDSNF